MRRFAVILAGGEGRRAGGMIPKQFVKMNDKPVVWWSMIAFKKADPDITLIIVLNPGYFDDWEIMIERMPEEERIPHVLSCGGKDRAHSAYNGLLTVKELLEQEGIDGDEEVKVAIHDGARPLVSPKMIEEGFEALTPGYGVIPAVKSTSSLRKVENPEKAFSGSRNFPVDRNEYFEVQTPQSFFFKDIFNAYSNRDDSRFTDDASLAERYGTKIRLIDGEYSNIKVTNPIDFAVARALMNSNKK